MYKYSTHLNFSTMKRALFTILTAAVCGSMTATAVDATSVKVTLQAKSSSTKIEKMGTPQTAPFPGTGLTAQPVVGWQVVNVPVKVEAKGKGDKSAQFVTALTFNVHLLVESDAKDGKPVKLSKEITYQDIPVSGNGEISKTEMSVGVFIPPSSAVRINEKGKGDLKGKLLGVAIEASFNGKSCLKSGEPPYVIFDNNVKKNLKEKWWEKGMGDGGAVLCSIDETPYAAWSGTFYPAILSNKETAGVTPLPVVPVTTTPETETTPEPEATTPTTEEPEAAEEDSKRGNKKGRNKKNRR